MDYKNIGELIKTVSESQVTSFEIETEGIRIKIEKKEQVVVEKIPVNVTPLERLKDLSTLGNIVINGENKGQLENNIVKTTQNTEKVIAEQNIFVVKSPIVGTMYSSPSADSENFVKVGSKVKIGDTLCILEAMKLMNEIESEVDGEVVEIFVLNEDMVEYGQPLFKIKTL